MKTLKTKIAVLAMCSALALPAAASAATATDSNPPAAAPVVVVSSIAQTNVNGVLVPGIYVINNDSRVAYIPGGVGLVVVNKNTALPIGAYYVNK